MRLHVRNIACHYLPPYDRGAARIGIRAARRGAYWNVMTLNALAVVTSLPDRQ